MSAAHADPHETSSLSKERVKVGVIGGELQDPPMTVSMPYLTVSQATPHHRAAELALLLLKWLAFSTPQGQQALQEVLAADVILTTL